MEEVRLVFFSWVMGMGGGDDDDEAGFLGLLRS